MRILTFISFACLIGSTISEASTNVAHNEVIKVMEEAIKESDLPSVVAVAINSKGHRIEYAYGGVSWGKSEPVKTSSLFRIHSMTKIVTSIAAMQLVDQEKVELDQDLSELLPEMAEIPILKEDGKLVKPKNEITLRHLLTHTAGFGYPNGTYKLYEKFDSLEWGYQDFPRQFESGTQFLYGTNTDWVGKLIEKISGMTLEQYFKKKIFKPLGIKSTYFNVPKKDLNRIVSMGNRGLDGKGQLKEINGDEVSPSRYPKEKVNNFSGGDGLFSTPSDFTKILECILNFGAHKNGKLLKKKTVELMMQNHIGDIILNPKGWYYDPATCCNFNGIMDGSSKWGLATLIDNTPKIYGRSKGTLVWGGYRNTYFYIDLKSGIAASIYSQHLPFNHPATILLFEKFSEAFYKNFK
tara:strand:- start:192 stop:1418 length:1227 start_codon:yes stop_codon:yes gene_type:complete